MALTKKNKSVKSTLNGFISVCLYYIHHCLFKFTIRSSPSQQCLNFLASVVRLKQTFQITKTPTGLNFCRNLGQASRNKVAKVSIGPMCAKSFIENIAQTKIVDHKITYKSDPHTYSLRITIRRGYRISFRGVNFCVILPIYQKFVLNKKIYKILASILFFT